MTHGVRKIDIFKGNTHVNDINFDFYITFIFLEIA